MEAVYLRSTNFLLYIPAREFIRPSGNRKMTPVIHDAIVTRHSAVNSGTDLDLEIAIRMDEEERL